MTKTLPNSLDAHVLEAAANNGDIDALKALVNIYLEHSATLRDEHRLHCCFLSIARIFPQSIPELLKLGTSLDLPTREILAEFLTDEPPDDTP